MGTSVNPETGQDLIRKKAYEIYLGRGRTPGREVEDWLAAERAVDRELQSKSPTGTSYTVESTPQSSPLRTSSPPKVGAYKSRMG